MSWWTAFAGMRCNYRGGNELQQPFDQKLIIEFYSR